MLEELSKHWKDSRDVVGKKTPYKMSKSYSPEPVNMLLIQQRRMKVVDRINVIN